MDNENYKENVTVDITSQFDSSETFDNRLRFVDGRLFVGKYNNETMGFEPYDVTEQVAQTIAEYIKPQERPKYIVRINDEYLKMIYLTRQAVTDEQRNELFMAVMQYITDFIKGKGNEVISALSYVGRDGKLHDSFTLQKVEDGDPVLAIIEDLDGNEISRIDLKEKED